MEQITSEDNINIVIDSPSGVTNQCISLVGKVPSGTGLPGLSRIKGR